MLIKEKQNKKECLGVAVHSLDFLNFPNFPRVRQREDFAWSQHKEMMLWNKKNSNESQSGRFFPREKLKKYQMRKEEIEKECSTNSHRVELCDKNYGYYYDELDIEIQPSDINKRELKREDLRIFTLKSLDEEKKVSREIYGKLPIAICYYHDPKRSYQSPESLHQMHGELPGLFPEHIGYSIIVPQDPRARSLIRLLKDDGFAHSVIVQDIRGITEAIKEMNQELPNPIVVTPHLKRLL